MNTLENINPTLGKLLSLFRLDVTYTRGEGSYLFDVTDTRYLDFTSQYGALPFGYNPPEIWKALTDLRDQGLPSLVQPSAPERAIALARRIAELAPGDLSIVTFVQSGAEAVEAAIKLARSSTHKLGILTTLNAFHGKTLGALSATGQGLYQEMRRRWPRSGADQSDSFHAPARGFLTVAFNDLSALEAVLEEQGKEIAAFIVEPVQAEAGVIVPDPGYLRGASELCRRYGVLLVLDEVQTGLGRIGSLFACEQEGVAPDILLLAKGLGGGLLPLGACVSSPEVWTEEFGMRHSSTFANNNFACAAGLAALDLLTRDDAALVREVAEKGKFLIERLANLTIRYPLAVKEVRGAGLLVGVEFHAGNGSDSYQMSFLQSAGGFIPLLAGYLLHVHRVRTLPFFNQNRLTLRLEPPLTVTREEIDTAVSAVESVCGILERRDYSALFEVILRDQRGARPPRDYRRLDRPVRCAAVSPRPDERPTRFVFLIHYPSLDDIRANNPCFADRPDPWLEEVADVLHSYGRPAVVCHMPVVRSPRGGLAEGWLVGVPYLPLQMIQDPDAALRAVTEGVDLARSLGAEIVGLGAYTSIVARGGEAVCGRGVAITTGNSLTVVSAVESALNAARLLEIDPARAHGVVVGATGSVGRLASLLLSETLSSITLVGNPSDPELSLRRLQSVADEMYAYALQRLAEGARDGLAGWLAERLPRISGGPQRKARAEAWRLIEAHRATEKPPSAAGLSAAIAALGEGSGSPPIRWTTDLPMALREGDIVVSASSAAHTLIGPSDLRPGALVCDVARPPDVSQAVQRMRDDVLVMDGGLIEFPEPISFGQNLGFREGLNLACLSETVVLALEGRLEDRGIGSAPPITDLFLVRDFAKKHGFRVAAPRSFGRELTDADILAVSDRARRAGGAAASGLRLTNRGGRGNRSLSGPF